MTGIFDFISDGDPLENPLLEITDTDGVTGKYHFLDIVTYRGVNYAVLAPEDDDEYVDIFRIITVIGKDGPQEKYAREAENEILDKVFEIFTEKSEME